MQQPDSVANLANALLSVRHPSEEARILAAAFPAITRSGRQHEWAPLHYRLLSRLRFGASDCWHWCGNRNEFGYGRMTYHGRMMVAHRLSYEAFVGPIPDGLSVLHRCDNPSCINPDHLWLGTYSDNRRDALSKGRWRIKNPRRKTQ